jgi:Aromatic acid exporter family member 1
VTFAPAGRLRDAVSRIWVRRAAVTTRTLRLTGAAVAAYLAALLALDDPRPVLAPLTALLVVQVTLVGTLADTFRRIISVVAGVAVAIVFSAFVGFSWWSLGLIIAVSLLIGQMLRLGAHQLEVPISAMLVLAVGGSEAAALDRINATIVGAAVGLLVNVIFPPAVQSQSAGAAVEEYARDVAGLLDSVAAGIDQPVTSDQVRRWLSEARDLTYAVPRVEAVLDGLEASRRLNPRAIDSITTAPGLRSGLSALEHTSLALRALYRLLADVGLNSPGTDGLHDPDVRVAFGVVLHDVAAAIRDFGALVHAEADDEDEAHPEELAAALESAGEARARLTELLLVDPQADPERWQLIGALLTATDRALRELDLDERARLREAQRGLLTGGEAVLAAIAPDKLVQVTRSATHTVADAVVDAVAEVPHRRAGHWVRGREED